MPNVFQTRSAVVRGARTAKEVSAYLPSCYQVTGEQTVNGRLEVLIEGVDYAGWTLEAYVIPRLVSGMMFAEEVLS